MTDIFQPRKYNIPYPIPNEILLIEQGKIESYAVQEWANARLMLSYEGYFRLNSRRAVTEHNAYVNRKCQEMYEVIKTMTSDTVIVQISYHLENGLQVGVYIKESSGTFIGCMKGYRADAMTPEEYEILWFGPEGR